MKATHKILTAAAAFAGAMIALATPAAAAPPPLSFFSIDLPGTNTAGANGYCPFPVHIEDQY